MIRAFCLSEGNKGIGDGRKWNSMKGMVCAFTEMKKNCRSTDRKNNIVCHLETYIRNRARCVGKKKKKKIRTAILPRVDNADAFAIRNSAAWIRDECTNECASLSDRATRCLSMTRNAVTFGNYPWRSTMSVDPVLASKARRSVGNF